MFNLSPLFLEFLMGKRNYKCTPWGMPTYNHFRLAEALLPAAGRLRGHLRRADARNEWANYGTESGNPKCANCMVHSGYEASAVNDTFSSVGGFLATVRATLFNKYQDPDAWSVRRASQPEFRPAGADHRVAEGKLLDPHVRTPQKFASRNRRRRSSASYTRIWKAGFLPFPPKPKSAKRSRKLSTIAAI